MNLFRHLLPALALAVYASAIAQPKAGFPTHCKPGEFSFLDAKVGRLDKQSNAIGNRKLLSLCADRSKEPFGKFTYRYGPAGKVELEQVATAAEKFGIHARQTTPKTGEEIIFFGKGEFSYYVVAATGMGRGISLRVFKSGKKIADLWSGLEESDYESNLVELDFRKAASPVFANRPLNDKF